jgi:hypothetical protein
MGQVVQQVAQARGVNVVLNQSPIVYVTTDFDLTPQVVEVLNKVLPAVVIPPDGVSPVSMATPKSEPGAAPPTAAAEPATPPPAKPVPPAKAPAASTPAKH